VATRAVAGTVIQLEITQLVSSKTNKRGDKFTLRLAEPITVAGQVLVPAGTTGVGEVIDSGPPGMAGTPGKLVLAARYLDYQGQHIPIRSLKVGGAGKDHTRLATGVVIAVGLPGLFITGGNIDVPAGTLADAKLAADYPPAAAPVPPTASASDSTPAKLADQGTSK
jgi:hypothetical protein